MYENWWDFVNSVPDAKIIISANVLNLVDGEWLMEKDIRSLKQPTTDQ
jgi:hypothetical protein